MTASSSAFGIQEGTFMRVLSILIGLLATVLGLFIASHGPSDIQIGIGATAIMGGVVLLFLSALLGEQTKIRRTLAEILANQNRRSSPTTVDAVTMHPEEREAYDRRVAEAQPRRFDD